MTHLSDTTLTSLPANAERPLYDRRAIQSGVVHLGIGAFHRAHQAAVFEAALNSGDLRWGITAASLRSPDARDRMMPQDGLYTLVERDGDTERLQIIGAVRDVIVAPEDPAALIAALARPETHLVTLTITEKGYALDPATGKLRTDHPDIAADMADLSAPHTAAGFLVAGLRARRDAGLPAFTTLSCDNLAHNGRRLHDTVLTIASAHDPELADWIADAAFPETMIDRIVPATTDDDIAALAEKLGVEDRAMVKTEPFLQWVIEDRFGGPRPDFASLGVQLTTAVAPWEEAKLRLLNGAHSAMAYLGGLAGIDYIHEVVAEPAFARLVEALWDESVETLSPPPELDILAYRTDLMTRFANSALQHRTRQIAMDGSQKLPQRLIAPLIARLDRGLQSPMLSLGIAAWMRWGAAVDDGGEAHTVDDPLAETLADAWRDAVPVEATRRLLAIEAVFPARLREDEAVVREIVDWLERLCAEGAAQTVRHVLL